MRTPDPSAPAGSTADPAACALAATAAGGTAATAAGGTAADAAGGAGPGGGQAGPFAQHDFVVVDVETTGWQPGKARITEIAAVRIRGGTVREVFSSLVNPGCPIPEPVVALTGITDEAVAGAPPIAEVLPGFLTFACGAVLTAHNAPFDVGFLSAACESCGVAWPDFPVLDTVAVARVTLSPDEVADCKLATLAEHFAVAVTPRHRALADALATADVLQGLLSRLAAAGVGSLAEVTALVESDAAAATAAWAETAASVPVPLRWWRRYLRRRYWRRRRRALASR